MNFCFEWGCCLDGATKQYNRLLGALTLAGSREQSSRLQIPTFLARREEARGISGLGVTRCT